MSAGVPLASWKTQILESLLGFLPDWVQITVLALVVLAVLTSWVLKLKRRIAARRALRAGAPVHAQGAGPISSARTPRGTKQAGPPTRAAASPAEPTSSAPTPRGVRTAGGADHRGRLVIRVVRQVDRRPDTAPDVGGSEDGGPGPAHPVPPRAHANTSVRRAVPGREHGGAPLSRLRWLTAGSPTVPHSSRRWRAFPPACRSPRTWWRTTWRGGGSATVAVPG